MSGSVIQAKKGQRPKGQMVGGMQPKAKKIPGGGRKKGKGAHPAGRRKQHVKAKFSNRGGY